MARRLAVGVEHVHGVFPGAAAAGYAYSHWVVLAHHPAHLGELLRDGRWQPLPTSAASKVWTDDFSDILGVFRWR